jgi:hypothetical protein
METVRILDPGCKDVGSVINIPDPQHCIGWDIRNQEEKINTAILTCFQIYVIQGRYRGRIIPLAFALMKTRRAGCYKRVWEVLAEKTLAVTTKVLAPRKIVTDFEVKLLTWFN